MEKMISVNALPAQTYRFLKVNDNTMTVPSELAVAGQGGVYEHFTYRSANAKATDRQESLPECIHIEHKEYDACPEFKKAPGGMGPEADSLFSERQAQAKVIRTESGTEDVGVLIADLSVKRGHASIEPLVVHAERDSEITLIVNITEDETGACAASKGFLGLSTRLYAGPGARINLIHVFRPGRGFSCFDDVGAYCEDNARVTLTTLVLGGAEFALGCRTALAGDGSDLENRTGYYCSGHMSLDMNYIADQYGKDTYADMVFHGVLADQAKKTFRGTLDFKKGSSGSAGEEQEDTLLLSPEVVNKAVPVILCGEEDVEGHHGATIGQLSDEMLFYMRSRGYSDEEARRIIVQARLRSVADLIPDEKLRWEVGQWIERNIV